MDLDVSGGAPPYQFRVFGTGAVLPLAGSVPGWVYRAPSAVSGTGTISTVLLTDAVGQQASLSIRVVPGKVVPNDEYFGEMDSLNDEVANADINAPEAWAIRTECSVLIGVLDSGVDVSHPDLSANLWTNPADPVNGLDDDGNGYVDDAHGWNFYDGNANVQDENLHGTHVTGILAARGNNSKGTVGVCWRAKVVVLKFLDSEGEGYISDAVEAVEYAHAKGVKVLNNSWGGSTEPSLSLKYAIEDVEKSGMLFVAAAGNDGSSNDANPFYPASFGLPNVIAVAATGLTDHLASFSNYGMSVAIAAPGQDILSTTPMSPTQAMIDGRIERGYDRVSGTSMAAPLVSGAAALLWSSEPSLGLSDVRARLLQKADALPALESKIAGARRLNLRRSLETLLKGRSAP